MLFELCFKTRWKFIDLLISGARTRALYFDHLKRQKCSLFSLVKGQPRSRYFDDDTSDDVSTFFK